MDTSPTEDRMDDTFMIDQSALRNAQRESSDGQQTWTGQKKDLRKVFAAHVTKVVVVPSKKPAIQVYLRSRPTKAPQATEITILEDVANKDATAGNDNAPQTFPTKIQTSSKQYEFTAIFPPSCTQNDVYENTLNSYMSGLRLGKSALIFCYGRTNTGKTHTVTGDLEHPDQWGLLPRAVKDLLPSRLAFFEIYNDQICDLLQSPKEQDTSSIKFDPLLKGVSSHAVDNMDSAMRLIRLAHQARRSASNNINARSSRSHAVCRVELPNKAILWIIDLAGSEKAAPGMRWKESICINRSLNALNRCFLALKNGKPLPYRDSKLTMIVGQHWKGENASRTTLIVNLTLDDATSTAQALEYASVAARAQIAPAARQNKAASRVDYDINGRRRILQSIQNVVQMLSPRRNVETDATGEANEKKATVNKDNTVAENSSGTKCAPVLDEDSMSSSSSPSDKDRIVDLEEVVKDCEEEMARMHEERAVELEEIQAQHEQTMQELRKESETQISSLEIELQKRQSQLEAQQEKIEELDQKYTAKLQKIEEKHEDAIRVLQTEIEQKTEQADHHKARAQELELQLAAVRQELANERSRDFVPSSIEKENSGANGSDIARVSRSSSIEVIEVPAEEESDQFPSAAFVELKPPPRKVRADPTTGKFLRPRGRAPDNALDWDENKGAWRVSIA